MIGIYKIENLINGQKYIGQSNNITKRWKREQQSAFNPNAHEYNYPISKAFRKYGIENFSFEVIEECSLEKLNERERYWVSYYNTFFDGYNQTLGGDSPISKPKEHIIGIITDLKTTDLYHREIAEKWKVSQEMVQGINTGRYWYQEDESYPLQKMHKKNSYHIDPVTKKSLSKEHRCLECGAVISRQATLCSACYNKSNRKVERPTAEELFQFLISIKGNFSAASRHYGVSDNAIRKWCKAYNIPSKSADYKQR